MLDKKKYKQEEVEILLKENTAKYEKKIKEQKDAIDKLNGENKKLSTELNLLRGKDSLVGATLKRAEKTALDVEKQAQLQYILTVERLKDFSKRWGEYFDMLKEKYPLYPAVKKAVEFKAKLDNVLSLSNPKEIVESLDKDLSKLNGKKSVKGFNPKSKIQDYIAATTGDNGFNLDEVLNPGSLQLEDLCKELGLIDGK